MQNPNEATERAQATRNAHFIGLDALRFLMAFCVVLFHYEILISPHLAPEHRLFGAFDAAVDFFFMLSGFVICHVYGHAQWNMANYASYLWRRLARIYPLHLLTLVACLAVIALAAKSGMKVNNLGRYDLADLPAQLLMVHAWGVSDHLSFNTVSWSISAEFFVYLLFPLLATVVRAAGWVRAAVVVIVLMATLSFVTSTVIEPHWLRRSYDFGALRALPTFTAGIVLWHLCHQTNRPTRAVANWFAAIAAIVLAMGLMLLQQSREALLIAFAAAIVAVARAEATAPLSGRIANLLQTLGNASYGLYMLHLMIGMAIFKIAVPRIGLLRDMPLLAAALALAISLVAAIASYRVFEAPVRRLLTRRRSQPTIPPVQHATYMPQQ
ncbi:MAG: acyltransferase [Hyphomicrobiaceae bacterium]|nr:acyltransferase [Hyphomicrobiaceae bacterium]